MTTLYNRHIVPMITVWNVYSIKICEEKIK